MKIKKLKLKSKLCLFFSGLFLTFVTFGCVFCLSSCQQNQTLLDTDPNLTKNPLNSLLLKWNIKNESKIKTNLSNQTNFQLKQFVTADGSDNDVLTDKTTSKNVDFNLILKKIILTSKSFKNAFEGIKLLQQISPFNDEKSTGSYWYENWYYELDNRIHNWINPVSNNIFLKNDSANNYGIIKLSLYLTNKHLWEINESVKKSNAIIQFGNQIMPSYDLNFQKGIHRDIVNRDQIITGIPFLKVKESEKAFVLYNYADRFVSWINAQENIINDGYSLINSNNEINGYYFDPTHLLAINDYDHDYQTISIGFNHNFFELIYQLEKNNKLILEAIDNTNLLESQKQILKELTSCYQIDHFNINKAIELIKNNELAKLNSLQIRNHDKLLKYQIHSKDNFEEIFSWILKHLTFNLKYTTSDPDNPNELKRYITNLEFNDLMEGYKIILNPLNPFFQVNSLSINQINNDEYYLPNTKLEQIDCDFAKIDENNCYYFLNPEIAKIKYIKTNDKQYYPSQLSDTDILRKYFELKNSSNEIIDPESIDSRNYLITCNDFNGTIKVRIKVKNNWKDFQITGFQNLKTINQSYEINLLHTKIINSEIDQNQIKQFPHN